MGPTQEGARVHGYASWTEERIATSRIDGVLVRLNAPQGGVFPELMAGCEGTHQIGMWTSEIHRPRGLIRYGGSGDFTEMRRQTFVPAGVEWMARVSHAGPVRPAIFCDFDEAYFQETVGVTPGYETRQFLSGVSSSGIVIQQALRILVDEVRTPGFSHAVKVDSLCRLMLVELAREFGTWREDDRRPGTGKLADWQIRRIREYVETVEGQPITVADIAALCEISPPHLRRLFKATTGTSVSAYVDGVRLERAKTLLADRARPLKQISHILGFANPSAFSSAFRRAMGITPRSFRQQEGG